jgi:cytochrome P450
MQKKPENNLSLLALRRHYKDPHNFYDTLRKHDSIYFDDTSRSWLVTGQPAIIRILDDPRFSSVLSSVTNTTSTQMLPMSKQMLFMDGERHRQAQNVMLKPLAQLVKQIPSDIHHFGQEAIAAVRAKKEMEVVSEFASPISLLSIALVLGIPLHDRHTLEQLERWSDTYGDLTSGYSRGATQDIKWLEEYFRDLISLKKRTASNDLLSAFIQAGAIFPDEDDLIVNCMMTFAAGRITTKKLLGNGISYLMPRWEEWRVVVLADPRLLKPLVEELLRKVTPTRYLIREATEDVELSSLSANKHIVRRGEKLFLFLEAANYDPDLFTQPTAFDPWRRPNKHIAFGYGPHQCPGAALARVEIQVALEELFALSSVKPKPYTSPVWNTNPNLGGFVANRVVFME